MLFRSSRVKENRTEAVKTGGGVSGDTPFHKEVNMDGLIVLCGVSLALIDLCAIAYLLKAFAQMVFKFVEIQKLLDDLGEQ